MDQARFTTDGINFDSKEALAWVNRVFQGRLDELEVKLFDTRVLRREDSRMNRRSRLSCLLT